MRLDDLNDLIVMLRRLGVVTYSTPTLTLTLGPEPYDDRLETMHIVEAGDAHAGA
jgi:hypothetical protein